MEDLSDEFFTENSSINVEFLNNRAGKITAGAYLMSITEILSDCQQIETKALLIINNYILGLLWGTQWVFYLTYIENVKLQKFQLQDSSFSKI